MSRLQRTELHGDEAAYHLSGEGETLLLIHGMAGSSDTWRAVIPQLSRRYQVLAPDLPGHGRSAKPRGDYSLGAFAAWLRDLLDELGIPRVTVVGQSLGGGVAMQFSYQHPELCNRLVLIGSGGLGRDVNWTLRLLAAPGAEFLLPLIAPGVVREAGNKVRSWLGAAGLRSVRGDEMWQSYASLSDPDTRQAFLRTLRAVVDYRGQAVSALSRLYLNADRPTQLIWGDSDRIIPVAHAYAAHEAMPGSRLAVLDGVGHYPHLEAPGEVVNIIDDFVSAHPAPAREFGRGFPGRAAGWEAEGSHFGVSSYSAGDNQCDFPHSDSCPDG
ncbi:MULTISPECIES: alpha/beta fold hydrolase [Rhodococcus]|uniref:Alpha/beta fold hydrolase n=1 Tax=Rhodococcus oxybenzonivorans TaxID=1990687 RepID=A0AAE4V4I8_9NOCA|nr:MULTISPECIES: alpha/beta fold hydrolase [Rhodococcus]MDV7242416.1 alpha/beta fold hydrolase [Rhodococcus oxybenzonivorans]MDV7268277.1 alpha/beta fold hydrolase [Rhodococcus oxybenzonivorans]MDV7277163.1 alpha/beta fold hydrolase [Rhodococcus oxybenzonivorans]MDV7331905.1 alpha/beta fold hydrolase [Rhodococcus oxybenzonivorans]MDV7344126.1 alpha/beta fold hydrolase [Rhodococcus oxybenzonivorans]